MAGLLKAKTRRVVADRPGIEWCMTQAVAGRSRTMFISKDGETAAEIRLTSMLSKDEAQELLRTPRPRARTTKE